MNSIRVTSPHSYLHYIASHAFPDYHGAHYTVCPMSDPLQITPIHDAQEYFLWYITESTGLRLYTNNVWPPCHDVVIVLRRRDPNTLQERGLTFYVCPNDVKRVLQGEHDGLTNTQE